MQLRNISLLLVMVLVHATHGGTQDSLGPHLPDSDQARLILPQSQTQQHASPERSEQVLPLGVSRPTRESRALQADQGSEPGSASMPGWTRIGAALGGTLVLALGSIAVLKRITMGQHALAGSVRAPSGLVQVLARYPLAPRQNLIVLKLDRRILLLSQSAGGRGESPGVRTLTEITDPEDVASILLKTRDDEGDTIAARFREAMERQSTLHESMDPFSSRRTSHSRVSELV